MLPALWLTCWISAIHFSFSCCLNLPIYLPKGQPGTISCPLRVQYNYTVTWYRNDSDVPITTDNYSRVHQQGNLLWFHPMKLEDSGMYQCVYNSTRANRNLIVFENSIGLCFNTEMAYIQKLPLHHSGRLTCPDLHNFRNYEHAPLVLQWYKACHLHLYEDWKFQSFGEQLLINNITKEDEGIYICKAKHTHMGKEYNISRAINLTTFEQSKGNIEIIYPNNNSVEVKPGSRFELVCNVSVDHLDMVFLVWELNYMSLTNIDEKYKKDTFSGKIIKEATYNISKMKDRDYGKYFCAVWSFREKKVAYVMLKHPAPNIQIYLIGGLVSPLFVILAALLTYKFFKVDIVLWYRDSCRHLSKGIADGKVYDAYVLYPNISSYVYLTDTFVLKLLPEILEKQCGYKLFILGRDDVPGQAVITIVDKVIKLSRRVIIILMPDLYCSSMQSSVGEREIAVYNTLIQEETKVILIELEKIKDFKSMPESLRYLKQKHGILTWRGDFTETTEMATTRFWKNVRYQMPASRNPLSSDLHFLPITFHSFQISEG
ncbi:interleukin-1 receptor type 1-like [Candoia aspera]|uniref:interleukin-1 receptor type 1-like n=1 Tax=Candoia aspera TaxID=51853 RepID=UPI002FD8103C